MTLEKAADILFVVNDEGNFLAHRRDLALCLEVAGFRVAVAIPGSPTDPPVEGFVTYRFSMNRRSMLPWQEALSVRSLNHVIQEARPRLVHTFTIKPVVYGGIASRWTKVPALVSSITGLGSIFIQQGAKARFVRTGLRQAYRWIFKHKNSRVIFQNPDDMAQWIDWGVLSDPTQAVLIRSSGINLKAFPSQPMPGGIPLVVLPARMLREKGVIEFLDAAHILRDRGVQARFVLVGDVDVGNPSSLRREDLVEHAKTNGVEWWGWRSDMAEVYRGATIVCLPSYREGVPRTLMEAAATGRPIVTTNVPGCREVVHHGVNGLLVPAKDAHALAVALQDLLGDSVRRGNMGKAGRLLVENGFTAESVNERIIAIYAELGLEPCEHSQGVRR